MHFLKRLPFLGGLLLATNLLLVFIAVGASGSAEQGREFKKGLLKRMNGVPPC